MRKFPSLDNLLLLVSAILILPGLFWGLPSAVTPQVDSPMPLGPLLFVAEWGRADANTTYPAFHQILQLPFYAIAGALFFITGQVTRLSTAWPFGFRDPSMFLSVLTVISNVISAAMAVTLIALTKNMTKDVIKWRWVGWLLLVTNGVFIYYARVSNLDLPYVFWWAVATYFLWQHFEGAPLPRGVIPAALAAGCAIGSKDQAVGLALGGALAVLLVPPGSPSALIRRLRDSLLYGAVLVAGFVVVAILPQPARWWHHIRFVTGPHAPTDIPRNLAGETKLLGIYALTVVDVFGIPALILAALGAFALQRARPRAFWLLVIPFLSYYAVIVGMTRVVYPRFVLPLSVPMLIFWVYGAAFIGELLGRMGVKPAAAATGFVVSAIIVWSFINGYLPVTYTMSHDVRRELARDLPSYVPTGSPLLIARMQVTNFPNRDVYERYRLMVVPGDAVKPENRVTSSQLHSLEPVKYYLLGSGTAGVPWHIPIGMPPLNGTVLKTWRYPSWATDRVLVPTVYEFSLYRLNRPIPSDYVPPPPPSRSPWRRKGD